MFFFQMDDDLGLTHWSMRNEINIEDDISLQDIFIHH